MSASFNVLREAWLPVADRRGHIREMGLLDALEQAHTNIELLDSSPLVQFGIYRVLIAFVMDAYNLKTEDDWLSLWEHGQFDASILSRYVEKCGNRFDLFDPQRPFLQSAPDPASERTPKMISTLIPELASGNNAIHFDHYASDHCISPAVAARSLCAVADFSCAATFGRNNHLPSGVNGAPPWYVLIRGRNLFETILLNSYVLQLPETVSRDAAPPWRRTDGIIRNRNVDRVGFLEGLVFQPRYLRLIPDDTGGTCTISGKSCATIVRQLYYGPGFNLRDISLWRDPNAAYVTTNKGVSTVKPKNGKAAWRDMGALFFLQADRLSGNMRYSRPTIISQFRKLAEDDELDTNMLMADVYGLFTEQAKVFEWQYERMAVPLFLLTLPYGGLLVQEMLDLAESTGNILEKSVELLLPQKSHSAAKRKPGEDVLVVDARRIYWGNLEEEFKAILRNIAEQGERDNLYAYWLSEWKPVLKEAARGAMRDVLEQSVNDYAKEVAAVVNLEKRLAGLLNPKKNVKRKEGK